MQALRTNKEWIQALSSDGAEQAEAIEDLRQLLLRAALYTLVGHLDTLHNLSEHERVTFAEDCAQEALLTILSRLDNFRGDSKFTTWAYKFGVNIALTRARQEQWKQVSLDELSDDGEKLKWLPWNARIQADDSELPVLQNEVIAVIQKVILTDLTTRQRQVLKWIAFDGVPMDVIVQRLHTNRNAVYQLLHNARVKVKRQLEALGYEVEEVTDLFRSSW